MKRERDPERERKGQGLSQNGVPPINNGAALDRPTERYKKRKKERATLTK